MFRILDGRDAFYQWDIDRQLAVDDASITQVHFCNGTDDCSLVVAVVDGVVNVPNILLQDSWVIKAYGYDANYTKHCKHFKVHARTKPSDYVYTETEIFKFTQLEERVNQIEEKGISDDTVANAVEGYLKENPVKVDLTGYATEEYVENALDNFEIPEQGTGCNIGKAGTAEGAEIFNDYEGNIASGVYSVARNIRCEASGKYAIAEGYNTKAIGDASHAEGYQTTANHYAHAEGTLSVASGINSHAEGNETVASGGNSHSEGTLTQAIGDYSHAEGACTIAASECQHVEGKHNVVDNDNRYIHIVGNGADNVNRHNAYTLDWSGNAWFAFDVYVGGNNMDEAERLATESYVNQVASGGVDLSGFTTEEDVIDLIDLALSNIGIAEEGAY